MGTFMGGQSSLVRAVVASPRALLVRGVADLLSAKRVALTAGTCASLDEVPPLLSERRPQLLVLDLDVAGLAGTLVLQRIVRAAPGIRILAIDSVEGSPVASRITRSGIGVVVAADATQDAVVQAARALASASRTPHRHKRGLPSTAVVSELSARQREVLAVAAGGATNRQIADALGLAEGTVKRHLFDAFKAMAATSRIDAINRARSLGYLPD